MAVDYTKVFTILGKAIDKVIDYYALVGTFTTDQAAIETVLAAQSVTYLEDDLPGTYLAFKNDVSSWIADLIAFCESVLVDPALVTNQFAFGTTPSTQAILVRLIEDMDVGGVHLAAANTSTIGSPTYTSENTSVGVLRTYGFLDGVTSPASGYPACRTYVGIPSELTPTSESLTFECIQDSEIGGVRGGEQFIIVGTGTQSGPYSATGENVGTLGSLTVADSQAAQWLTNSSFDTWGVAGPTGWTVTGGVITTDFVEVTGANTMNGLGSAFQVKAGENITLEQTISKNVLTRMRGMMIGLWAISDDPDDVEITIGVESDELSTDAALGITSAWSHLRLGFSVPREFTDAEDGVVVSVQVDNSVGTGTVTIDALVVVPIEYHAGVGFAIFDGPEKFLIGDRITVALSNNDSGKFQSFFRKAFGVQLPTTGSSAISDSLVA
jgi:hypothetical protein